MNHAVAPLHSAKGLDYGRLGEKSGSADPDSFR
jgi:hypothetical protein